MHFMRYIRHHENTIQMVRFIPGSQMNSKVSAPALTRRPRDKHFNTILLAAQEEFAAHGLKGARICILYGQFDHLQSRMKAIIIYTAD